MTHPTWTVIKTFIDISDNWMRNSKQEMRNQIPQILIDKKLPGNIGNWALKVLTRECYKIPKVMANETCNCERHKTIYGLPCVHDIMDQTKTFENCIPKEYFGWEITPALTSTPSFIPFM